MPRQARSAPGGLVYHVINRGNGRRRLFGKQADYLAFEKVMIEAMAQRRSRPPVRAGRGVALGQPLGAAQRFCVASPAVGGLADRKAADWIEQVNRTEDPGELDALRQSVNRSAPYGSAEWVGKLVKKLDLQWTVRPRGRPRVRPIKDSRPL